MSPLPFKSEKESPAKAENKAENKGIPPVTAEAESTQRPITILSELDSYIAERMKEQPQRLEDLESRVEAVERASQSRHRLSLPAYFQERSADQQERPGPYVFRWLFKEKRSIDRALNVLGWTLVNRTYFPEAPRYLFTANGGVEIGDGILAFMPAKQALAIRALPGKRSLERIQAQLTNVGPDYALMTGDPKSDRVYQPALGPEAAETTDARMPGMLTEGRDF